MKAALNLYLKYLILWKRKAYLEDITNKALLGQIVRSPIRRPIAQRRCLTLYVVSNSRSQSTGHMHYLLYL